MRPATHPLRHALLQAGAVVAFAFTMSAPAAGQEPALKDKLVANVPCAFGDPVGQMKRNADNAGADQDALVIALAQLSSNDEVCEAVRKAAVTVSGVMVDRVAVQEVDSAMEARRRLEEVLLEADTKATAMRFEVGPPPRNLTRSSMPDR